MILVTGAAGLLGRELLRQLSAEGMGARGVDLQAIPSANAAETLVGDLLDPGFCREACRGVETVIHTAARQHHSQMPRWGREQFFCGNSEMTQNLARAASVSGSKHFIFLSSDMVYGMPPKRPLTEEDSPQPIGPYGRSKQSCERACSVARPHGVCVTVFRPRLLIGPGRLGVLQKLFDRIRQGRTVPILGSGNHRYQMVSVADVATACVLAVKQPADGIFNLGSSDPPGVRTLLNQLCRRAGSSSQVRCLPAWIANAALWALHTARIAPLAPEQFLIAGVDYVLDTSKAQRVFGWQPRLADVDMLWSAYQTYVAGLGERADLTSSPGIRPSAA